MRHNGLAPGGDHQYTNFSRTMRPSFHSWIATWVMFMVPHSAWSMSTRQTTNANTSDRFVSARRQYALGLFVCDGRVAAISLSAFWLGDKAAIERFARMLVLKPVPRQPGGGLPATMLSHLTRPCEPVTLAMRDC
jgi:hypothetical protein